MLSLRHRDHRHLGWDASMTPAVTLTPGETVELELADCFGGQLSLRATPSEVLALDPERSNPLTGPVAVDGAVPGDALVVEVLEVAVGTTGWTPIIPGFGLLADEFPDPYVVVSHVGEGEVEFGAFARLPARPMLGTLGCAPAAPGPHGVIPPRRVGGNLDCRELRPGVTLLLPVEVPGARFSAGDAHATQGDGEVCGTGVEIGARTRLRVGLRRGLGIAAPQLELPPEPSPPRGRRVTTLGVGPDLMTGARDATRSMIERLGREARLAPEDAYTFCSVAGDLRIHEVVDAPNWVVGMELDLDLLG